MNKYQIFWLIIAIICLIASIFFAYLFIQFYWQWRDLFYENGRYLDEVTNVVYDADAKYYSIPCVFFFIISEILIKKATKDLS